MDIAADGTDPGFGFLFLHGGEELLAVLAQGAEVVVGDLLALIDIATDGAHPLLFLGGSALGLGLDVALVIAVGAGGFGREHLGIDDLGDEEDMAAQIQMLSDLAGEQGVGGGGQVVQAVFAAGHVGKSLELIYVAAGLHTEALEQGEGSGGGQSGDVELPGAQDHLTGQIFLDGGDGDSGGVVGHLNGGVDDAAVVAAVLLCSQQEQSVGQVVESLGIHNITS